MARSPRPRVGFPGGFPRTRCRLAAGEVAVPRQLFAVILEQIEWLAMQPAVCPSG